MTLRIDIPWIGDSNHSEQRGQPKGIVFHSGDKAAAVAEAALKMDVSYHAAHHAGLGKIVQLVDLDRRAWHAGTVGNDWIGVAVAGPDEQNPRPDSQRDDVRHVVELIKAAVPSVEFWCRHSDIEAKKTDPGPGFLDSWMDGLLVHGLPTATKKKSTKGEAMKVSAWIVVAILGGLGAATAAYYKKNGLAVGVGGASLLLLILHFAKVLPPFELGGGGPVTENNDPDLKDMNSDPQGDVDIGPIKITEGDKTSIWSPDPVTGDYKSVFDFEQTQR